MSTCKKNSDPFFILYIIINLKWIKDLNIKAKLAVSTFLAPGTGFMEDNFSTSGKGVGMV